MYVCVATLLPIYAGLSAAAAAVTGFVLVVISFAPIRLLFSVGLALVFRPDSFGGC